MIGLTKEVALVRNTSRAARNSASLRGRSAAAMPHCAICASREARVQPGRMAWPSCRVRSVPLASTAQTVVEAPSVTLPSGAIRMAS